MTRAHKRATSAAVVAGLVAALALLAAGCGGSDDAGTASTATETTAANAIKVGLITDLGQLNDNGFNELAYNGLKRAERELGVKGRVVESKSAADYVPNMSTLARQGYDLIIGVGFAQGDAIATAAKKFPNTKFAIVDVDQASLKGKPANVAGAAVPRGAGRLSRRLPRGARGEARRRQQRSAPSAASRSRRSTASSPGYKAGARRPCPGSCVKWGYSQDWDDQAKCKELALNQIAAGSKVVFQVAGGCGLGALLAAKQQKVWGIGVDGDQSFLGPHVLTSALKGVDSAVFLTIQGGAGRDVRGRRRTRSSGSTRTASASASSARTPTQTDIAATEKVEQQIADGDDHGHPDDGRLGAPVPGSGLRATPASGTSDSVRPSGPSTPAAGGRRPAPSSRRRRPSRRPRRTWRRSRARGPGRRPPCRTPRGARSDRRPPAAGPSPRGCPASRRRRASPRRGPSRRGSSGPRRRSSGIT